MSQMSQTDHDLLIQLNTKVDMFIQNMTAIQADQLKMTDRIVKCEDWQKDYDSQHKGATKMAGWLKVIIMGAFAIGSMLVGAFGYSLSLERMADSHSVHMEQSQ